MVKQKNQIYSIRGKLVSAVAMLLVAVIMVVSSTYAWFTLSTAPEVVGIQTAVGANGALEMLLNAGDILEGETTTGKTQEEINRMWGNLVDVSDASIYGLDKITLLPSALNDLTNGDTLNAAGILKTPKYGSDGRVQELLANTILGTYDKNNSAFYAGSDTGVRAVGVASGMTDRQLAYRTALANATIAKSQAQRAAINSLSQNGGILANIVAKRAMSETATFVLADIQSLQAIVNDILSENGPLANIEEAYAQYIIALAASSLTNDDADVVYNAVTNAWATAKAADAATLNGKTTLQYFIANLDAGVTDGALATISGIADELAATRTNVTNAQTNLATLAAESKDSYAWSEISSAVSNLANTDAMTLNGYTTSEAKENLNAIVNDIAGGKGIQVDVTTGGGVYADIADHCGNYSANIIIKELAYGSLVLTDLKATMNAKTTKNPVNLEVASAAISNKAPAGGSATAQPLTEFYGYIIDLAFRTNAANSNLLLQVDGTDRIYDDNEDTTAETWGHGSSMTFKATTDDFSDEQVKSLMACIRIIFFDTGSNKVLAYAALDTENATLDVDGWTAKMYLYAPDAVATAWTTPAAETVYKYEDTYYSDDKLTTKVELAAGTELTAVMDTDGATQKTVTADARLFDNVITSLPQNTKVDVSTLVYLDGNTITNADVAATAASSMTGTMNLQFASSAELVPMEYGDLHTAGGTDTTAPSNP